MKYALLIYSGPGAIDRPPEPAHDGVIDNWAGLHRRHEGIRA